MKLPVLGLMILRVLLSTTILTASFLSVTAQESVYWRAESTTGDWEWGSSCDNTGSDGHWHWVNQGGFRKRPDCYNTANIIFFDNGVQPNMYLNSTGDYAVNQIKFTTATVDRVINTVGSNSLWFKQNNGNAKIENLVSFTTQTFNVDVNVDAGTSMEFNPVNGYLVFNNPVYNRSGNTINVWGFQHVTFNENISNTTGNPGIIINQTATVVLGGVAKTFNGSVTVTNGATFEISSDQSLGDLVLNTGGNLVVDAGKTLTITGSWTGGGNITNNGTIVLAGPSGFPGSGTTVSAMTNLTINRAAGVTLDKALTVSGVLTLSSGILTTSSANLLSISNTATTAITGGSVSSFISGPVTWSLPALLAAGSTYQIPAGKGSTYLPMTIIDPTTGAGTTTITAEAFTGNAGGTPGSSLSSLSSTEYWSLASTGNLTSHKLSLTRQSAVSPYDRIGRSTTQAGTYLSIGGTPSGNSIINSGNTGAGAAQYFLMAKAGPINVAGSNPLSDGDYVTLQSAFTAINGADQTGKNIVVTINGSTTETSNAILNAGLWSSMILYPTGSGYSISGSLAGSPIIDLNGADQVTINGSLNGTGSTADLTISNTSTSATAATSTIRFKADATNNLVTYCNVLGSATMALATNGGTIIIGGLAVTTGNDNNTISNCNIGPAGGNLPTKAIYMNGTTTTTILNNSGITITNNHIYDFFKEDQISFGIYVGNGNTDCNFTNNRFYQTGPRTQTTGAKHAAIWIDNPSGNNFVVSGNTIGYSNPAGSSGKYTLVGVAGTQFTPICLNTGSTSATIVQGNTIAEISMWGSNYGTDANAPFIGIDVQAGLVSITENTIGSDWTTDIGLSAVNSIASSQIVGIYGRSNSNFTTNNNFIGGIAGASFSSTGNIDVYALRGEGTGTWTCTNNTIGSSTINSIENFAETSQSRVFGIYNNGYSGIFTGNIIRNLTNIGGWAAPATSTAGIYMAASSANQVISQNTIYHLTNINASNITEVAGIFIDGATGTNLVERNFLYSFTNTAPSTLSAISGIRMNSGTNAFQNNIVSISAPTSGSVIYGFKDEGGTNNLYFNSVSLSGNVSSGTQDAAFFSSAANSRNLRNNIFANARTGSGVHNAIDISSSTGLTIDYNDYVGLITTPSGGGTNSVTISPGLSNPSGTSPNDYIPGTPTNGSTTTGVVIDYGGNSRTCAFTMGAWEVITNVSQPVFVMGVSSSRCQGATSITYTATANNTTGITYSLDAVSLVGGNTINAKTGTVTYVATWFGTTVITASATGCGGPKTSTHTVTVHANPVCSLTGPTPVCNASAGNIYTTESGMTNYSWAVTGGSITSGGGSTNNTATITWNTAGTQTVSVNYTDASGCSAVSPTVFNVTVNPLPTPAITGKTSGCRTAAGEKYLTTKVTGNTYTWVVTGGTIQSGQSSNQITVQWQESGVGIVQVTETIAATGCNKTASIPVAVYPSPIVPNSPPLPGFVVLASPGPYCEGGTITFESPTGFTSYHWELWSFGSPFVLISSGNTTVNTWVAALPASGSYFLKVNAYTVDNCQLDGALYPATFIINPKPVTGPIYHP